MSITLRVEHFVNAAANWASSVPRIPASGLSAYHECPRTRKVVFAERDDLDIRSLL